MKTKERIFKNIFTSVIGATFMGMAVYISYLSIDNLTMTKIGLIAALCALGYVFLMAKDSLIEGLFFGAFKINKPK